VKILLSALGMASLMLLASCSHNGTTASTSPTPAATTHTPTALQKQVLFIESGLLKDHYFGSTPLMQAACQGDLAKVELALSRGDDVNWKMEWGLTALMWAADQGHTAIAQTLLAHGADVNAQNDAGLTALMLAAREGRLGMVKLLLAHHADRVLKDASGQTAGDWANAQPHKDIVALLRK